MKTIRDRIKSGEIDKTVNAEKQNRHIRGSSEYTERRSYLLDCVDAQELVDKYHGRGQAEFTEMGHWRNTETITASRPIGFNVNQKTGEKTLTCKFKIHYSKTGTHIVPTLKG